MCVVAGLRCRGVLSYLLHFSPLYVLIPAGFLVLTIALGARASRHARAWETKVSKLLAQERRERTRSGKPQTAAAEHVAAAKAVDGVSGSASEGIEAAEHSAPAPADQAPVDQTPEAQADAVETSLMEQQEIHRAVEQGMAERDRRLARRAFRRSVDAETGRKPVSMTARMLQGKAGNSTLMPGRCAISRALAGNGRDDADAAAQAATDDTNARNTQSAAPAEPAAAEMANPPGLPGGAQ